MNAAIRKHFSFFIILSEVAGFAVSASLYHILKNFNPEILPVSSGTMWKIMLFFLISLADLPFILRIFFQAKDELEYDEFGVRNMDKHKMSREERMQIELRKTEEMERVISLETLKRITHSGSSDPEKDLSKLTGLLPVKNRLKEMEARMIFDSGDKKRFSLAKASGHHMVFTGNPGTGKTTVARIITGLLWDYGYIDSNKIVEIDGNFLKSTTPADSSLKTKVLIRTAYGGVLFIDEAYSLMYDEYGLAAVATLMKEIEDNRGKFVLIMAGYGHEMEELLGVNPGFRSRIRDFIDFGDYTKAELISIFINMARDQGFQVDDSCIKPLSDALERERFLPTWGNARTVRTILDNVIDNHAVRFVTDSMDRHQKYVLASGDFS